MATTPDPPRTVARPAVRPSAGPSARRHLPRWLLPTVSIAIVAGTVWFVVVPQFAAAKGALHSLEQLSLPLVLAAVALEVASVMVFSGLTTAVLGRPGPGYFTLLRVDLTDLGINHVVPGGGTTSGAVRLRLLVRLGVPLSTAFATATVEILGSNLVLGLIFGVGIASTLGAFAGTASYLTAAIAVLALLGASVLGLWALVGHTAWAARLAGRIPLIRRGRAAAFVRSLALHLRRLGRDRPRTAAAIGFAAGNWLLDASALGVVFVAFGRPVPIGVLLTVYCLGSILATVPLTPGGLGLVEAVMVPAFAAFGVPATTALLGVIGWRLMEYWLPLPVAALAYGSLRLGPLRVKRVPVRTSRPA